MQTLDKLVDKLGLNVQPCKNSFQQVDICLGGVQPQLADTKLPFCIARAIFRAPMYSALKLHQFWLASTNKPLACFLLDEDGNVVERVYYQNSRKHYDACDKLIQKVQQLSIQNSQQAA